MKTVRILLVLLVTAVVASAQPPPNAPPRPDMPGPDGPREARRALDRWMNQMQQAHPEDYERLMQLKETDPEAFQAELRARRDRLRNRNLEAGMAEMPRFREMMEEMPPEERKNMAERFSRIMRSQYKHPGHDNRQVAAGEQKTRELAKAYRAAPEAEKETLRAELRTQIEQVFALRDAQNQRQIDEAEKHLQRLKDALGKRREFRNEIVERRLRELTEGDLSARERPRPASPRPPD